MTPVMATNTIVCVKQSGEITTLKSVQKDPDNWKIHDVSSVLKPKYKGEDDDATYGYITRSGIGNDVKLQPEDSDYVDVALLGGDLFRGYKNTEKEGYQGPEAKEAHDNNSYDFLNPSTV